MSRSIHYCECGEEIFDAMEKCPKCEREAHSLHRLVSSQPRLLTQKRLKEIAKEVASDVHKHYGVHSTNERRIYEALKLVKCETMAANDPSSGTPDVRREPR